MRKGKGTETGACRPEDDTTSICGMPMQTGRRARWSPGTTQPPRRCLVGFRPSPPECKSRAVSPGIGKVWEMRGLGSSLPARPARERGSLGQGCRKTRHGATGGPARPQSGSSVAATVRPGGGSGRSRHRRSRGHRRSGEERSRPTQPRGFHLKARPARPRGGRGLRGRHTPRRHRSP